MATPGQLWRRAARVVFIYVPGGMALERYSVLDRLFENQDVISEAIIWLGPLIRAVGAILPAAVLALVLIPAPTAQALELDSLEHWQGVFEKVQTKIEAEAARKAARVADTQEEKSWDIPYKPSHELKTLIRHPEPGHLYKLRLESREHNLGGLMERCTYNDEYAQHFCWVSVIVNGIRPANLFAFNGDTIAEQPQFLHPKDHHPDNWLNVLELYVLSDGSPLQIKSTRGFWAVPELTLHLTDVTAWWEAEKQKTLEAAQRRLEEEERQYQLEQARLQEEARQAKQARLEAQRQWQIEQKRREDAERLQAQREWDNEQARLKAKQERRARRAAWWASLWSGIKATFRALLTLAVLVAVTWASLAVRAICKERQAAAERDAARAREREAELVKENIDRMSQKWGI